ncbi:MAG: hypothetical protein M3442_08675 [Chloroflexota bacterium]|nr:hypothetical protein [Chloroflexota bacterium]
MVFPGKPSLTSSLGWGAVSGLVGTAAMTAFQKLVEMPITGRADSYAPADFAEKVFPVSPKDQRARKRLNYLAHFGIGMGWGVAYALASRSGLRGQRAVATVFAGVYTGDVVLNTALGLYKPWEWSLEDTAIDVIDKLVQAEAAGAAFEVLGPS